MYLNGSAQFLKLIVWFVRGPPDLNVTSISPPAVAPLVSEIVNGASA